MKQVKCPTCGTAIQWSEKNLFRPFCGEKCRLIDFGDWANENHVISVSGNDSEQLENEDILPFDQELQ
jgi:endogenous inhibitor of DNA gyrase (YacG/DUF329 family)